MMESSSSRISIDISGIPKRFHDKDWTNYAVDGGEAKKKRDLALHTITQNQSLLLTGGPGAGKTHLAIALLKIRAAQLERDGELLAWAERVSCWRFRVSFQPATEFFLQIKKAYNNEDNDDEDSVISRALYNKTLVLDDLGSEKITDWSRQMAYILIDRCYREEHQLVITSNLSLSQIATSFDDRIASRLVEMGEIIDLGDKDHRLKKIGQVKQIC